MSRSIAIALLALVISVISMVVAITQHSNPRVERLEHFAFPPPLDSVQIGDTPAQVRRKMGPPQTVHRYRLPPDTCWDYVFPTSTPHYRLCFEHGHLITRTPY